MTDFLTRRNLALELLTNHHERLSRKAAQFTEQCACDEQPLTPRQEEWFGQLTAPAGLTLEV